MDLNNVKGRDIGIEEVIEVIQDKDNKSNLRLESGGLVNPHLAGLDLETVWQDYWGKYGEQLVWEGWVAKYPDQIDFEKLHAVPATAEVEVVSEQTEGKVQVKENLEETGSRHAEQGIANDYKTSENESDTAKEDLTISERTNEIAEIDTKQLVDEEYNSYSKTAKGDIANVNQDELAHDNDKCNPDVESSEVLAEHDYVNPASPLKYSSLSFKPVSGTNIVNTLQNKVEGFGENCEGNSNEQVYSQSNAENLANERTEMVQMMHSYSSFITDAANCTNTDTTDNANAGQGKCDKDIENNDKEIENNENECVEQDNYDQMWGDLWNEHYTETYWYYYNQFAEKFNQLSPKHEPFSEQTGEVIFESEVIIIPDESGAINVLTDGELFQTEVLDNDSEQIGNDKPSSSGNDCDDLRTSENIKIESAHGDGLTNETSKSDAIQIVDASKAELEENNENSSCINKLDKDQCEVVKIEDSCSSKANELISSGRTLNDISKDAKTDKVVEDENGYGNCNSMDNGLSYTESNTISENNKKGNNMIENDETVDNDKTSNVDSDTASGEDSDSGTEPEDGSRKKRKKKERLARQQAQTSSGANTGIIVNN